MVIARPDFKIAAAQVASVRGDIDRNVATHATAMAVAARCGVSLLVFPELSLTGYELDLAADLAMTPEDPRLEPLRDLARRHRIEAVVGAPLKNRGGKPTLSAISIGGTGPDRSYAKMHLGGDEPRFFAPGNTPLRLTVRGCGVGIAICADSSRPSHPEAYAAAGAEIYAAGVFLTAEWYQSDAPRLASHARRHGMLAVMANHGESVGSLESVGKSAAWTPDGEPLVQAAGTACMLVIASRTDGAWSGETIAL